LSGWIMVPLVFLATLALQDTPQAIKQNSPPDTSRTQGIREMHQESARTRQVQEPSEGSLFLNQETILDWMLSGGGAERRAAAIDSLLRVHPELKGLVLRALLTPQALPGFFASSPPSRTEAWRLAGNSSMTPFERSGLIKARQMELHDRWTEGRILAPQVDMKRTVIWILELLK
jgi:hypothetical protein